MIRWYDYILAIVVADAIVTATALGFNSTSIWEPIACGIAAGLLLQIWDSVYCTFRAKQEYKQ